MNKVFVIVVTYNGKQWYDQCFTSLRNSELPVEVVVIDNASSDDTLTYIATNFPEIHIIESKTNLGFGQANNKGMRYALDNGCEYVFLLNQDAWIEPNTLKELIEIQQKHTEYGILSPMHINAAKNKIEKGLMNYIADYRITSSKIIDDLYFHRLGYLYETNYVNAAGWLLPRKTLEIVGGFDPIFYHYGEDDNYMHRVKYHGFAIGICPQIIIVHDTDRRVVGSVQTSQSATKNMLVQFTDITKEVNVFSYILYSLRKAIISLIKCNSDAVHVHYHNAYFLFCLRKAIGESRRKNKIRADTWL